MARNAVGWTSRARLPPAGRTSYSRVEDRGLALALKLVATIGTQTVTLPPGRTLLVGRTLACDLALQDQTVSRQHAELELAEGGLRVRDLGSMNGTFWNGERVGEFVARPGDQIAFGRTTYQVLERPEESPEERPELPGGSLDATVIRQIPAAGPADIAARVSAPGSTSLLRIGGQSAEERQAKRLALLLDIGKELSGLPDIGRLLDKVVELTFQVMSVDRVAILLTGAGNTLTMRVSRSRIGDPGAAWEVPRAIADKALAERVAVLIENPTAGSDRSETAQKDSVQSAMCAPLLGGHGEPLGLIYLDNLTAPRSFSDEDLEFLSAFSGMVAVAIENGRLVERARREALVLSNFQRYFAPELAEQIAGHQEEIGLGGAKRQAVVLFADIRGFTALSEELSPEEIAALLNEYFTAMVEIVFEHGGALDKFMGDAMMAIWGAPLSRADDADRAVRAAVAMQAALARLNEAWQEQGRRRIAVGIGINSGEVFAGNIGSDRRLEYTVIGDAVNVAARLCAEAGPGEILVGEPLYRSLADPPRATPLAPLPLRGRAREVAVYRVEWTKAGGTTPASAAPTARGAMD